MKKIIPYILILLIIVNLFAPVSIELVGNRIKINKNEVYAAYNYALKLSPTLSDKNISIKAELVDKSATGDGLSAAQSTYIATLQVKATVLNGTKEIDNDIEYFGEQERSVLLKINGLDQNTSYKTKIDLIERVSTITTGGVAGSYGSNTFNTLYTTTIDTPTTKTGDKDVVQQEINASGSSNTLKEGSPKGTLPACSIAGIGDKNGSFTGCIADATYYLLFQPTSYIFALSGTLFDKAFAYSVDSDSYRSDFVNQGWKIVRDFCNMFFIFILLYIAITTILNTHGANTKEMIINVVIIGLLINFSLFTTRVIIDMSNVLARVFYNSDTIKITDGGANGVTNATSDVGADGVLPMSAAIVNKINPQNLIINASKVNIQSDTRNKGVGATDTTTTDTGSISPGTFILVTLLATAVNIVGLIVFLSVALIFITRVIGLWLAMIVVPFAFLSYTVPAMQDFDLVGWKKWWPETLKLAFLAPVFIFFLYLIIKFLNAGFAIMQTNDKEGLTFVIGIVLPFIFIMVFLMKAKDIAKDMSGKMGQQITDGLSKVGGFALGAATGGAAMLGRMSLGNLGNKLANSKSLAETEAKGGIKGFGARMLLKSGDKMAAGSFDFRNTKAGSAFGKETGLGEGMGYIKPNTGGVLKAESDRLAKRTERADKLKHIAEKDESIKKRKSEVSKKLIEDGSSAEIRDIDTNLEIQRQKMKDAATQEERVAISNEIKKLNSQKMLITEGGAISKDHHGHGEKNSDGTNKYTTDNGRISEVAYENIATKEKETKENLSSKEQELENHKNEESQIEESYKKEIESINKQKEDMITSMENEALSKQTGGFNGKQPLSSQEKEGIANKVNAQFAGNIQSVETKKNEVKTELENKIIKTKEDIEKAREEVSKAEENLKIAKEDAKNGFGKSIKEINKEIKDIDHEMHVIGNKVANDYANWIGSKTNKALMFFAGGSTKKGTDEAVDSIRLGIKTKSTDSHGSGNSHGGGHATPAAPKKVESKKEDNSGHDSHGGGHDSHGHGGH